MACVFDEKTARVYENWFRSRQGRMVERCVEEMIRHLLDPRPGMRVLDVGCGSGNHLLFLSRMGLDVSGLDASPTMVKRAAERLGPRCELRLGRAEDLPFEDNAFDAVVMIHTLEFLADPVPALREAGRVASSKIFVGVMNTLSGDGLLGRFKRPFRETGCKTHTYNVFQIKGALTRALGQVQMQWRSGPARGGAVEGAHAGATEKSLSGRSPFGPFLGTVATLRYRVRTDNLPLKLRIKEAGGSVAGAKTLGRIYCGTRRAGA